MKQITIESVTAFLNDEPFKKSNMVVEVLPHVTKLILFGNEIAYRYSDKTMAITNAGWQSNTTKERLNGLPNVSICQRKGKWYLNGELWNGEMITI